MIHKEPIVYTSLDAAEQAVRAAKVAFLLEAIKDFGTVRLILKNSESTGAKQANQLTTARLTGFVQGLDWMAREFFLTLSRDSLLTDPESTSEALYLIEAVARNTRTPTVPTDQELIAQRH